MLFALLFFGTGPQLYIWTATNLAKDLDAQAKSLTAESMQLSTGVIQLTNKTSSQGHAWTSDENAAAAALRDDSDALLQLATRARNSAWQLERVVSLSANLKTPDMFVLPSMDPGDEWFKKPALAITAARTAGDEALRAIGSADVMSGIFLSFVLPILFGAIGAVAYVIRTISDQIKTSTFSSSSPIRHLMRVTLGALMGSVIGLFNDGLTGGLKLPPLALAFLAGYGVEAVFSLFDGLVERLRQPTTGSAKQL